MKIAYLILLLSLVSVVLGGNAFRPRVNTERIKREDVSVPEQPENVNDEEKISDEGWVQRPAEDSQPSSDDIPIEAAPEKPEFQAPQGNVTSLETLQIGSVVVDATKAIAGAISTIAGGVVQATEGIVGMIYRPLGNFTFIPRESCKLRISDAKTKLYKDTQMNCVAMSRLIRDVEFQSQKVDVQSQKVNDQSQKVNDQLQKVNDQLQKDNVQSQKVNDQLQKDNDQSQKVNDQLQKVNDQSQKVDGKESIKVVSSDLKCVFIRIKPDTTELEKRVDCELLQAYTQKYSP